jgi:hypothetical protein
MVAQTSGLPRDQGVLGNVTVTVQPAIGHIPHVAATGHVRQVLDQAHGPGILSVTGRYWSGAMNIVLAVYCTSTALVPSATESFKRLVD